MRLEISGGNRFVSIDFNRIDNDGLDGHILVHAPIGGFHIFDFAHHVQAFNNLTKDRIAIAIGRGILVI
jgi:hypothetical protein